MKKIGVLLFSTIKNYTPSCGDCKFYTPNWYYEFNSTRNKCNKFSIKNKQSGVSIYETVFNCRANQSKCGIDGRYFEKDPNADAKRSNHYFDRNRHIY